MRFNVKDFDDHFIVSFYYWSEVVLFLENRGYTTFHDPVYYLMVLYECSVYGSASVGGVIIEQIED